MDRTRLILATKYPFYASMLSQMRFAWGDKTPDGRALPTAAVALNRNEGTLHLIINRNFFASLSQGERVGLLMHEVLHVALKHLVRGQSYPAADRKVLNVAMDIALNQYIPAKMLPQGACLPGAFNLPPDRSFDFYYGELMKNAKKQKQAGDAGTLDDHGFEFGEGEAGDKDATGRSTEYAEDVIDGMVKKALANSQGSLPHALETELVGGFKKRPEFTWQQRLRNFAGRALAKHRESTRNRPNRRMGLLAPGLRSQPAPRVLIGMDMSGSVSNEWLKALYEETAAIVGALNAKTEIAFFDTEIHKVIKVDEFKLPRKRYASGGTDFQCIADHAKKTRPDLVIMMTDGGASPPVGTPCPIIWAVVDGCEGSHLPGMLVKVKVDAKEAA